MKSDKLEAAKQSFVNQWGTLGSGWGVNRTFAQILALLMVSDKPLNTDQIMEKLSISRGNAHSNLKDLISWGLAKSEIIKGDRKEYFVGEKDPWKMFVAIAKVRTRKEVSPTAEVLNNLIDEVEDINSKEAREFQEQLETMIDFIETGKKILNLLTKQKNQKALNLIMKVLK